MKLTRKQLVKLIKEELEDLNEAKAPGSFTSSKRGRVAAKNIQELNATIEALERRLTKIEDVLEEVTGKPVIAADTYQGSLPADRR